LEPGVILEMNNIYSTNAFALPSFISTELYICPLPIYIYISIYSPFIFH